MNWVKTWQFNGNLAVPIKQIVIRTQLNYIIDARILFEPTLELHKRRKRERESRTPNKSQSRENAKLLPQCLQSPLSFWKLHLLTPCRNNTHAHTRTHVLHTLISGHNCKGSIHNFHNRNWLLSAMAMLERVVFGLHWIVYGCQRKILICFRYLWGWWLILLRIPLKWHPWLFK